ncbi:AraC family transcriptional regulator, partial [Enterococcus faecium]
MIKRQSRRKINMLKDLNQLIDYIEEHLTEGLSYK